MGVIFYLSSKPPAELPEQLEALAWMGKLRDVAGHLALYGVLGSLVAVALAGWVDGSARQARWVLAGAALGVVYAVLDELHQSFIPGRTASALDVVVDSVGVAVGLACARYVIRWGAQRRLPHPFGERGRWRGMPLFAVGVLIGSLLLAVQARADLLLPTLEVEDVSVAPSVTGPGEPVRVEANVHNPSSQEAEFAVELRVDDLFEEERVVRLPPGSTQTLRFIVVRSEPGAHVVQVGSQAATFQVLSAQFVVRGVTVVPPRATAGELFLVQGSIENTGSAPGMYEVPLAIDGVAVDARTGLLGAGQTATISFEVVAKAPGTYSGLLGDQPFTYAVVSPTVDVRIPSSVRISLPTTSAVDGDGNKLSIARDLVSLFATADAVTVTLPVALPPGKALAQFRDTVSGVAYEGDVLTVPLRNSAYGEVARLVLTPILVGGDDTGVRITAVKVLLSLLAVEQEGALPRSPSELLVAPVTFGLDIPLANLKLDVPVRLTSGLALTPKSQASVELEARKKGRSLDRVVASATVDAPSQAPSGQDGMTTVTFGVPSFWLQLVGPGTLEVVLVKAQGGVELSPFTEIVQVGSQTLLRARVSQGAGSFALVALFPESPAKIRSVVSAWPVAVVGVPIEVKALAEPAQGDAVPGNAVLRVNNEPVAVGRIQTEKNGSRAATFSLPVRAAGTYTLDVEGTKVVLPAAVRDVVGHVQVSRMDIKPPQAAPGQPVQVTAKVSNAGPRQVVSQAILRVNGVPMEQRWLSLAPGEQADVSFQLGGRREGKYTVTLLNTRAEFAVAREPTPASFQVTDLRLDPSSVEPGKPVNVTILVRNNGEVSGTYVARVFVEKHEAVRRELTVGGLTSIPVTMQIDTKAEGVFAVESGGLRQYIAVVSLELRSDLVLESMVVEPSTVAGGEPVVATVTIRNRAKTPASGVIVVLVNGDLVAQRDVALEGRGRTQEKFILSRDLVGLYEVEARQGISADAVSDVVKGQFLVTHTQSPASWEISRLEVLPRPAAPQESLMLSFQLSNLGQQAGDFVIRIEVDGVLEMEENRQVGPQSTLQVSLPLKGRPAGSYNLNVSGTLTRFIVEPSAPETPLAPTPTAQVTTRPGGGLGIILGVTVALAMALGGAYLMIRRARKGDKPG